jgi:predicted RNA polymerase sigma factor
VIGIREAVTAALATAVVRWPADGVPVTFSATVPSSTA